jgi:signal transduction histidine kinase/CheY-like chemotaxis protein
VISITTLEFLISDNVVAGGPMPPLLVGMPMLMSSIASTLGIPSTAFWREVVPALLLLLSIAAVLSFGYIQLRREVARRRAAEIRLQAARDLADSEALAKSTFFAMMSHEIRTPLSGIIGMLDLLKLASIGAEQKQMLLAVDSAANALLHILDGVMDFSKAEANQISLESVPLNLQTMVTNVMMVMGEPARRRGIKTNFQIDAAVSPDVQGDPLRVRQILSNLISNAAKFTREGKITLTVGVEETTTAEQVLKFVVSDTGIGIAPEQLLQVMTPFQQADVTTTRRYGGTGLGLSVSSRLASRMGGELVLRSELGKGTRAQFTCRFPLSVVQRAEGQASLQEDLPTSTLVPVKRRVEPQTTAPKSLQRVLVADDHAINRELMQRQLAILGYRCDVVAEGAAVLEALQKQSYCLFLTDYQMPPLNATELVEQWRRLERQKTPASARLPIVVVTAGADLPAALLTQIDGQIRKPVTLEVLRAALLACLPPSAMTPALVNNHHNVPWQPPPLNAPQLFADLRQQFDNDAALKQFLQTSVIVLQADFAHATDLVVPQFCQHFADWLHRVLGALSMLGPWPVIAEGNALEQALHRRPGPELLPELLPFLQRFKQTLDDLERQIQSLS